MVSGIAFAAALLLFGIFGPKGGSSTGIAIGGVMGTYHVARNTIGPAVEAQRSAGGELASSWRAAGIGLASLALVLTAILVPTTLMPPLGDIVLGRVRLAQGEVYYEQGATAEQARRVAAVPRKISFINEEQASSAKVIRTPVGQAVDLMVEDGTRDNEAVVAAFRKVRVREQLEATLGSPLEVRLCDGFWRARCSLSR